VLEKPVQAPAPRTLREIAAYERRELKKPRTTASATTDPTERELEAAAGFSLELAGKERIHWANSPREASEKIVKLWDMVLALRRRLTGPRALPRDYLCKHCGEVSGESYRIHDELWAQTGLGKHDGVLHLKCVERLLGRPLSLKDFTHHKINAPVRFGYDLRQRELLRNGEDR
jgi:hypothetical protein